MAVWDVDVFTPFNIWLTATVAGCWLLLQIPGYGPVVMPTFLVLRVWLSIKGLRRDAAKALDWRGDFPEFSADERALVQKHLGFYRDLTTGVRRPTTTAQVRFLHVCSGQLEPSTPHEIAYVKFLKNSNRFPATLRDPRLPTSPKIVVSEPRPSTLADGGDAERSLARHAGP